jgi:hypothetical protein
MCRGVQYEYLGEPGTITVCHCSDCRKAQGSSSVIAVPIDTAKFAWIQGQALIKEYESSAGKKRAFCSCCGSPLYSRRDELPEILRLRIGTIDSSTELKPAAHIFVVDLPGWAILDEDWPRYEGLEPGQRPHLDGSEISSRQEPESLKFPIS